MTLTLNEKSLSETIKLVHDLTGITIANNRNSMVEGRLRKRLIELGLTSYDAYLRQVRTDKFEQQKFIDLVTTNETYFYRTPRIWEFIEKKLIPEWISSHPRTTFNAWSAASSSGEEAHTLAIICEEIRQKNPTFNYKIIGTDISAEMVELGQRGSYSGRSIESFKKNRSDLFDKYMVKKNGNIFEVISEIKSRIRFQQHNLFQDFSPKDKFDLVLMRNVLIYFNVPDQEKVISNIYPALNQEGVLIIGESESLTHIQSNFRSIEPLIFKQQAS